MPRPARAIDLLDGQGQSGKTCQQKDISSLAFRQTIDIMIHLSGKVGGQTRNSSSGTSLKASANCFQIGFGVSCGGSIAGMTSWPERSCSCNTSRASASRAGIDLPVSRDSVANMPFCSGVRSNGVCSISLLYQEKPSFATTACRHSLREAVYAGRSLTGAQARRGRGRASSGEGV